MQFRDIERAKIEARKFVDQIEADYEQGGLVVMPPKNAALADDLADLLTRFLDDTEHPPTTA